MASTPAVAADDRSAALNPRTAQHSEGECMQPMPATTPTGGSRPDRFRLLGFAGLVVLAGFGLAAAGGAPRLPSGLPRVDRVLAVLSGSALPVEALVLVLVDGAWLMWAWIVASLTLELVVITA